MKTMFPGTYRTANYLKAGETKVCAVCGASLPVGAFSRDSRVKSGVRSACGPCAAERRSAYRRASR